MAAFFILKKDSFLNSQKNFNRILRRILTWFSINVFCNSQWHRNLKDFFRKIFSERHSKDVLTTNLANHGVLKWIINNCLHSIRFRNFLRVNVHKYIYFLFKFYTGIATLIFGHLAWLLNALALNFSELLL